MLHLKKYLPLVAILLLTVGVYFASLNHGFTHLDDYEQVVNNANIKQFNFEQVKDIFSSSVVGMYQPVSTTIFAIVFNFFGESAYHFHLLSLLFHLLNVVLVFQFLKKLKIEEITALIFAGIFAFHPLQVESVAWVSAFSNLTFSSFYLLALIQYRNYSIGNKKSYFLSLLFFLFSLLSKSTAVTLPLVLLALDYFEKRKIGRKDGINKIPFFVLSIIFGLITIYSREAAGHLSDLSLQFDWFDRIFLIAYSILFYPFKWLFPSDLSVFYPYPGISNGMLPLIYYVCLPSVIALLFWVWKKRKNKFLFFGTLFYLFSISVVIQIIPVGNQLTTDRYSYLSMIGFILILYSLLPKKRKNLQFVILSCWLILLLILSHQRTKVWANDSLIWKDVIQKHPKVAQAYNNLGAYNLKNGNAKQAFENFNQAVKLKPYYADALSNRGNLYSQMGKSSKAIDDFNKAISLRPHADAYFNRANEYSRIGELQKALKDYRSSIKLNKSPDTYTNWAYALLKRNEISKAKNKLELALKLNPNFAQAHFLSGMIAQKEGNMTVACLHFKKAVQQNHQQAAKAVQHFCR